MGAKWDNLLVFAALIFCLFLSNSNLCHCSLSSLTIEQTQWHSTAALALGLMQKETLSWKCADPIKN